MKKAPIDEGRFRASDIQAVKPGRAIERDGGMVGPKAAWCQHGREYRSTSAMIRAASPE